MFVYLSVLFLRNTAAIYRFCQIRCKGTNYFSYIQKKVTNRQTCHLSFPIILIFYLIFFLRPFLKCSYRFRAHEMVALDGTISIVQLKLIIDKRIVKVDGFGIIFGIAIANTLHPCPIQCTQAHRTWLARTIYRAIRQLISAQFLTSTTYGHHLCMSGWIIIRYYTVRTRGNHLAITNDNGTKRTAALVYIVFGKANSHFHKLRIFCRKVYAFF